MFQCISVGKILSGVYVCVLMCVRHVFERVLGRASSYVCVCLCIDVCVYVCRPIMLWKKDRMKHAEIQQIKLHVSINRAWTDKQRVCDLLTR